MSEHDKLRAAIKAYREVYSSMSPDSEIGMIFAAAESTLPVPKFVECWQVEWVVQGHPLAPYTLSRSPHSTKEAAMEQATHLALKPMHKCIRITGPHQHEVPA